MARSFISFAEKGYKEVSFCTGMTLIQIPEGDEQSFEEFVREYYRQVSEGLIRPHFRDALNTDSIGTSLGLVAILADTTDAAIKGVLTYQSHHPEDHEALEPLVLRAPTGKRDDLVCTTTPGFRTYDFSQPLMRLRHMEALQKKEGIGTRLVDELKAMDCAGIFCDVGAGASGFYRTQGFLPTGRVAPINRCPVYIWMRSGEY